MQIQEFVRVYQTKSDEELVQLAVATEQLTSEARVALQGELSRRRISVAEHSGASQSINAEYDSGKTATGGLHGVGWQAAVDCVTEVFRAYHSHFWLYFQIAAPGTIISTIAISTARNEVREISRHLPRGVELLAHRCLLHSAGRKRGRIYPIGVEFFCKHSRTVESVPGRIFTSPGSRGGNGRPFDSVGDRCLLDIESIAGALHWLSDYGGFIWTRGSRASCRVTIFSGCTSSYSG